MTGLKLRCAMTVLGLLVGAQALAEPFFVESPPRPDRPSAEALLAEAVGAAKETPVTGYVVRRYQHQEGWQYLARVEGDASLDVAQAVAKNLAVGSETAKVFLVEDGVGQLVDAERTGRSNLTAVPPPPTAPPPEHQPPPPTPITAPPPAAPPAPAAAPTPTAPPAPTVPPPPVVAPGSPEAILARVVSAHGGAGGGAAILRSAQTLQFTYVHRLPTKEGVLEARNTYSVSSSARRLDVEILKGPGKNSTTIIPEEGPAWVVAGDKTTERDAKRAREVLARFAPEQVLAVSLGLPGDLGTAREWQGVVVRQGTQGTVLVPGEEDKLRAGGVGLVEAHINAEYFLERVSWRTDRGVVTFVYKSYAELAPGLLVPLFTRVEQDGNLLQEVEVEALKVDSRLDKKRFRAP